MRTLVDMDQRSFKQAVKDKDLQPEELWGNADDNRAILGKCMKGGWVHIRVNGEHRLIYLRGNNTK